jgi:iron complex outermembrane receptor protein
MGKPVDLSLFVTNLTDEKYFTYIVGYYNAAGFDGGPLSPPRMYGARLRYRFGD